MTSFQAFTSTDATFVHFDRFRLFFVCGGREGEFFFLPPGQLECYKKFTDRLHAPDHSTCIIQSGSWCHSGPFLLFALTLPHNSSPERLFFFCNFAWQALVGESLSAAPSHTLQAVTSPLTPPPLPSPAFLILTCLSLLLEFTVVERVNCWFCCFMKSFPHATWPPPMSSSWKTLFFHQLSFNAYFKLSIQIETCQLYPFFSFTKKIQVDLLISVV